MGYDDVITHLGDFGRYQRWIYFLICLPTIMCAFHKMAGVFLLAKPDYRCSLPFENDTAQYQLPEHVMNMSYPRSATSSTWNTCEYFDSNFTSDYLNSNVTANETLTCDRYVYDQSKFKNSAVTEFNIVCSRSWLVATSDAMFMVGVLLGSIIFGQLSDKYGRKPIFFASLIIQVVFGIFAGIAPEYITYTVSRLIVGATTSGVFLVAYVIAMEMVGPTYRLFAGVVIMMFFSVGYMLTALFAYFITDWRWLQIGLTLPGLLFMCYHWIIPESARWLLSKNRKDEAIINIKKAAKFNKVRIPTDVLNNLLDSEIEKKDSEPQPENTASVFDLMKYPNLRKKSLLIFFDWFVNSGTYYALSWNTSNLGGNNILNFLIFGAVEIPAYTFLLFTLNKWGRRTILCGCMLMAGTMLILTTVVPQDMTWLIVTLAMAGKLAITASYGTVYIFSAEQFPTVIRNVGLGAASMVARIGGILAPYVGLLSEYWKPLPFLLLGILSLTAGIMSLMLPETHNKPTLETIEDGEKFGKTTKGMQEEDEDAPAITIKDIN